MQTKQTSRTGTEPQKWRSHGGLSAGERVGRDQEKVQRISSINGRQKRQGEIKNSIGNGEAKELICMTHGHELRGNCRRKWGLIPGTEGNGGKIGTTIRA